MIGVISSSPLTWWFDEVFNGMIWPKKNDDLHIKWDLINNHDHLMGGISWDTTLWYTDIRGCPKIGQKWERPYNMVVLMRHTMIKTLHFVSNIFRQAINWVRVANQGNPLFGHLCWNRVILLFGCSWISFCTIVIEDSWPGICECLRYL